MPTVIVSACRTAFGAFGGSLKDVPAVDLGAVVIREAIRRAGVEGRLVDNVIMGMVVQAGAGQVPSRQASLKAGLPVEVPSETINKVCASSLRAVNLADCLIRAGDASLVVAGGMENMSQAPYLAPNARWGLRLGDAKLIDGTVRDGLWCPVHNVHMGVHGGNVAREMGVSREDQDRWAYLSQTRVAEAQKAGRLRDETVAVEIPQRKGPSRVFDVDEHPRPDTTLEKLAALPPVFAADGTVTAGNAPGINDGAGALVLASEQRARDLGLPVLATIVAQGMVSTDPPYLAKVPALSARAALEKAGLSVSAIKLWELNEAFAAVAVSSCRMLELEPEVVNVNGGAIAFGHPIGASGARILTTLVYELRRRGGGYGVAAICSGTGQGEATVVRVD